MNYLNKKFLILLLVVIAVVAGFWLRPDVDRPPVNDTDLSLLEIHEQAERIGFDFMLDFVKVAPPNPDPVAEDRIWTVLSKQAKRQLSQNNLGSGLAGFIGVQDVPDLGVSVEDLWVNQTNTEAILTVGLNYSGGRIERNINLIWEDGMWKVDRVTPAGANI